MNKKINSTVKSEALELARHYLQVRGYNGFSFQDIADDLGIKKASLYYHFASKEDLVLALIEGYELQFVIWADKYSKYPAIIKIQKLFKGFINLSEKKMMICPVGVLGADLNSLTGKTRKRLLEFHLVQQHWLVETLNQGKKEKYISKKINTTIMADIILSNLQGGVQLARIRNESESYKANLEKLISFIQN